MTIAANTTISENSFIDSASIMPIVPSSEVTEISICVMACCKSSFVASMSFVK